MGGVVFWGGNSAEGETYLNGDPWFQAWIAGRALPGKSTVTGGSVASLDVEDKKGKGHDGSRITIHGYKPGTYDISCEVWTSAQDKALQDFIDAVWATPKKKTKLSELAVTVHHPALAYVKIFTGVLVGVDPPKDGSFDGAKVVRFRFREFVLPSKDGVSHSPKASAPSVDKSVAKTEGRKNATPTPPSKDRKSLGPKGPPTPPAGGSD